MKLTQEEIFQLALRDAETESMENLQAAADMYDRLVAEQVATNQDTPAPEATEPAR